MALCCLLESAAGYALLEVVHMDEIGDSLEEKNLQRALKLKAFQPFGSAVEALENANALSEHQITPQLSHFLQANVSSKITLGVIDAGLATAIAKADLSISCRSDDAVREVLRAARGRLELWVPALHKGALRQAQLGLGHAVSRSRVKFNPARSDNMIIQSISLLDQLDKDVNQFAMRVREWYSWHFPELASIVKDNIMFARAAACIQDKKTVADKLKELEEIVGSEEDAQAILQASRTSMGMDCSETDMLNIVNFTSRMVKLAEYRKQLGLYLTEKLQVVAPNLSALVGDTVAARLISKAGSLTSLAKAPASTVQILGAEKALFRALKTKGNTPKYGLIYHSTFIGRADSKNKGRISRYLANKCSIATRIDCFSDEPSRLYGEHLREQVEERLKFYETGQAPRRNLDVMQQVAREIKGPDAEQEEKDKKKKKKKDKKKRKSTETNDDDEDVKRSAKKAKKEKKKRKSTE